MSNDQLKTLGKYIAVGLTPLLASVFGFGLPQATKAANSQRAQWGLSDQMKVEREERLEVQAKYEMLLQECRQ